MALYSASQRANKGRKRHRHGGLTASIYLSDKLGGHQIGTLVQTISWKNGPIIYDSIPDNTANTLMPLLNRHIPKDLACFTDEGYKFYYRINKNHRMINHSLKSKDKRHRFSRERWSKNGIHTQVAEGHHRNLKWNFTAGYGYIRPKYSQLYLNEYAFWRNVKYYGWNSLLEGVGQADGVRSQRAIFDSGVGGQRQAVRPRPLGLGRFDRKGRGSQSGMSVVGRGVEGQPVEISGRAVGSHLVENGRGGTVGHGMGGAGERDGELVISSSLAAEWAQTAKNGAKRSDVRQVRRELLATHHAHEIDHLWLNRPHTLRRLDEVSRHDMPCAHRGEDSRHAILKKTHSSFTHARTPDAVI